MSKYPSCAHGQQRRDHAVSMQCAWCAACSAHAVMLCLTLCLREEEQRREGVRVAVELVALRGALARERERRPPGRAPRTGDSSWLFRVGRARAKLHVCLQLSDACAHRADRCALGRAAGRELDRTHELREGSLLGSAPRGFGRDGCDCFLGLCQARSRRRFRREVREGGGVIVIMYVGVRPRAKSGFSSPASSRPPTRALLAEFLYGALG